MDYKKCSDYELLTLLRQQDHHSFTEIYQRYWAILFRHARKMLHDDIEASDVVQDIFTMMWSRSIELDINTNLSSYLYTSVRNKVLTLINKSKLKAAHLNSLDDFINRATYSTDEWFNEKELAASIEAEIGLLPVKMREIFDLSRKEHLSYHQIAEKLEVTDHTVRKQISNVLKVLKGKFGLFFSFF